MDFYEFEYDDPTDHANGRISEMTPEQWNDLDTDQKLNFIYQGLESQGKKINLIEETLSQMARAIENLEKSQKVILQKLNDH